MQWENNNNQGHSPGGGFVGGFAAPSPGGGRATTPNFHTLSTPNAQVLFPSEYVASTQHPNPLDDAPRSAGGHHVDEEPDHYSRPRSNSTSHHHHRHHHRHHGHSHSKSRTRKHSTSQVYIDGAPMDHNTLRKPHPQQLQYQYQPAQSQPQQYQLQPQPYQYQNQQQQYQYQPQPQYQPQSSRRHTRSESQHQYQVQPQDHLQKGIGHDLQHLFRYSKCTGTKKALCIGINYDGSKNELKGCVNDAKNVFRFLTRNWGFNPKNIIVLTDESNDPRSHPTRDNILNSMRWLVQDSKTHDSLFFHYSGHGGQVRDTNGDEVDGRDDVIFPVDYESKGIISDDLMNETMVHPLADGCRLTALFDSCHSGSVLDLVYEYHSDGRLKASPVKPQFRAQKSSIGDAICFSGCEDTQTSADTSENGVAVGAMSYTFIKCLSANPKQSYAQLLKNVRAILNKNYSQKPQLSSSHPIDIGLQFIL